MCLLLACAFAGHGCIDSLFHYQIYNMLSYVIYSVCSIGILKECKDIFYLIHNMVSSGVKKQPVYESLKEIDQQDAQNKAALFFNIDSREQAKKLRKSSTP